jgi:hypothetical protein
VARAPDSHLGRRVANIMAHARRRSPWAKEKKPWRTQSRPQPSPTAGGTRSTPPAIASLLTASGLGPPGRRAAGSGRDLDSAIRGPLHDQPSNANRRLSSLEALERSKRQAAEIHGGTSRVRRFFARPSPGGDGVGARPGLWGTVSDRRRTPPQAAPRGHRCWVRKATAIKRPTSSVFIQ